MVGISWQILFAIVGVIAGFVLTDKILDRKGYRSREILRRMELEELCSHLKSKYLVNVAAITGDKKIVNGVDDYELDEIRTLMRSMGNDEILLVSGSDYKYAMARKGVFIFIKGKFVSLEDFSKVWKLVKTSILGVEG
ncbi:MAG: hypothetical protein H0Z19_00340 [Archaeoglobus sp.]|uniref:hypothetical protein n=1 Tax=Archaeoglobus sp. TaxID=1872626 RepID=UPI001DDA3FBA|nr:hypothetical protein [Archaeoglobus sp.]MBO8178924.1 hypothetical protein [Archaeoglobus sp.]